MSITFDREKHEYRKDGRLVLSITQVLAQSGICDFSAVNEELRIRSMKRGQSVHWMLQLEDEGALNYRTVPRSLRGYRGAYCDWKRRSLFCPLLIEKPMFSTLGFAGTPDRAGTFPATTMYLSGTRAVVDFKTGEIPDWVRFQLAAQCALVEPNLAVARSIRRISLSLRPDRTYKTKEFPLCTFDSDISQFIYALRKVTNARSGAGTEAGSAHGSSASGVGQDCGSADLR